MIRLIGSKVNRIIWELKSFYAFGLYDSLESFLLLVFPVE